MKDDKLLICPKCKRKRLRIGHGIYARLIGRRGGFDLYTPCLDCGKLASKSPNFTGPAKAADTA
jgi:hypothetical protein